MPHSEIHTHMLRFFQQLISVRPEYSIFFYGTDLKYTEILGFAATIYKTGPMNLIGRKGTDIVPPETAKELEMLFENSVHGIPGETLLYYQNLLVPLTFLPLYSDDGKIAGGVLITQNFTRIPRIENFLRTDIFRVNADQNDIVLAEELRRTRQDLVQAREAMAFEKQKLDWVLESRTDAIVSVDPNFKIIFSNTYFRETIRKVFKKEVNSGDNYLNIYSAYPEMRADIEKVWKKVFEGESANFRRHIPPPLDEYYEVLVTPLYNNQNEIIGGTNLLRDVTADEKSKQTLREQQAKLTESEQKFRALFTESFQSVFLLAPNGTVTDSNRRKRNGDEKLSVSAKLWELPEFSSPAETPTIFKSMIKRAAQGENVRFEIDALAGKENARTFDFSLKPLVNNDRQVYMIIAEGRDITEIRKAREALEKSKIQQIQNRQLEEFAWLTSHNLRSPAGNLSVLVNLIERAETESEKQFITEKMRQAVANLMSSIDILAETVKIRQDSGKTKTPVYFDKVLNSVKDSLSGLILEASAVIYSDFTRSDNIYYYEDYLTSILQNLLSNSLKYRSNDRPLRVSITTTLEAGRTVLTFSDNGKGINLSRFGDKIFGLYKTFHGNKDAQGVGLFLVRNQVEATGGKITVESKVNEGAVFKITF